MKQDQIQIERTLDAIKSVGEEVIGLDEMRKKLESGKKLVAYDGFEPSGRMHIAQGTLRVINIQKLLDAGIDFKMMVADWLAFANNKLGGDIDKIQITANYFIELWKACGLDVNKIEFIWTSKAIGDSKYWETVLKIGKESTLNRVLRCTQIMGRSNTDELSAAQVVYPLMQASDIYYVGADVCQMGMDQRKVNILARDIADKVGLEKPAIAHHHMLMSLKPVVNILKSDADKIEKAIALKMSKSKPDTAIFMTDTVEEVNKKVRDAYCPPQEVEYNPILEYFRFIVFGKLSKVEILREEKFGGNVSFNSYDDLETAYKSGDIYPLDLKNNLARYLNEILDPVRKYFDENPKAKALKKQVESFIA